MKATDIANNLSWLFLQVSYRSKQTMLKLADDYDLTMPQLYTLLFMDPKEPLKMSDVAQLLVCDPSNVTGIIDRLFARELAARVDKPGDRRVKMVQLTPAGIKVRNQVIERIMERQPPVFDRLTPDQRQDLTNLLQVLLAPEVAKAN